MIVMAGAANERRRERTHGSSNKRFRVQTALAAAVLALGLVLLATNIYVESEPGAVPLLIVLTGVAWLAITRYRARSQHGSPR